MRTNNIDLAGIGQEDPEIPPHMFLRKTFRESRKPDDQHGLQVPGPRQISQCMHIEPVYRIGRYEAMFPMVGPER